MRAAAPLKVGWIRRWNYAIGTAAEHYCFSKPSTRRIIAVSRQVKEDIERHYAVTPERIVVIPHGVDAETFHPRNRSRYRDAVRRQLGVAQEDFVIVFVGRDYRLKGLPVLLEAVRQARLGITIIAVGIEHRTIPQLVRGLEGPAGRLLCVGHASDIVPYYAAADCFALPTRYDTFSLATLEAMASGLPVVVSRAAGVSEQLSDGLDSMLMGDPADAELLAHHLMALAGDRELRRRLGEHARDTAERMSWDHVTRRTVAVYREAIEGVE
jgi:UDP-glucose:(heptosyl)LPS alpha-1,3-glucosyltransferase